MKLRKFSCYSTLKNLITLYDIQGYNPASFPKYSGWGYTKLYYSQMTCTRIKQAPWGKLSLEHHEIMEGELGTARIIHDERREIHTKV
jgi:hypothetical protein